MPRRSGAETRDSIRSAATALFRERGYARTSVREIAALAEADPAVVIRQFGSKERLFLDAVQVTIDDEPLLDVPLEQLGRRFIELLLDDDGTIRDDYLALVRGSAEATIAERLRRVHEETFVSALQARLSGDDAELRARLAGALLGGLLYALWVVGDEGLLAAPRESIVEHHGALLQSLLTPGY